MNCQEKIWWYPGTASHAPLLLTLQITMSSHANSVSSAPVYCPAAFSCKREPYCIFHNKPHAGTGEIRGFPRLSVAIHIYSICFKSADVSVRWAPSCFSPLLFEARMRIWERWCRNGNTSGAPKVGTLASSATGPRKLLVIRADKTDLTCCSPTERQTSEVTSSEARESCHDPFTKKEAPWVS